MATRPERVILSYDNYAELPNDRNRYELFEGELQVTPAPGTSHQRVVLHLAILLANHVRQHQLGEILIAPCDVLLSDITVVQPDLLFVAREHQAIVEPKYVRGTPDLVVEVLSPSTAQTDRQTKRQLYARHGVQHYWLVDTERREAVAFVLQGRGYRQATIARSSEPFAAAPFQELAIPLGQLWE